MKTAIKMFKVFGSTWNESTIRVFKVVHNIKIGEQLLLLTYFLMYFIAKNGPKF